MLRGPFQADAATQVGPHLCQACEDVLHPHPHAADRMVGLRLGLAQRVAARGFAHQELLRVDLDEMRLMLRAVVGRVGQQGLVLVIEQFFKHLAVMDAGGRGGAQDDLGLQVGFHMVLPAIVRFVVLLGPACFAVFLAAHGGVLVELLGAPALLDALVRLAVVALARGFREARVDDAAFAGDDALAFEHLAEGVEELAATFTSIGLDVLLEVPERFGIGDVVADAQAEEGFKAGAVKICSSVASSLSPWNFCSTRTLNMSTGSNGGLPPLVQSREA